MITEDALDKLLIRYREACLFLIKSDGVALAALGTLASVFKLDGDRALEAAASITWVFRGLGFLLVASLSTWAIFVMTSVGTNAKRNVVAFWMCNALFAVLVLAHTGTISYSLGYLVGFLEHFTVGKC